jgi:hypothetical protein
MGKNAIWVVLNILCNFHMHVFGYSTEHRSLVSEKKIFEISANQSNIGPGSHVEYPTRSLKCEKFTHDKHQVMAIVPMDLWSR